MSFFKECVESEVDSYVNILKETAKKDYKNYEQTGKVNFSLPTNSSCEYAKGYKEGYYTGYLKALEEVKKY